MHCGSNLDTDRHNVYVIADCGLFLAKITEVQTYSCLVRSLSSDKILICVSSDVSLLKESVVESSQACTQGILLPA